MGAALFLEMLNLGSIIVGNAHCVTIITIATEMPTPLLSFNPILRRALFIRLFKLIKKETDLAWYFIMFHMRFLLSSRGKNE